MKKFSFATLAVATLLFGVAFEARAQSASLQASLELQTMSEMGASVRRGKRLEGGDARVRVKVTNLDARTLSIAVRIRFDSSNPLALDEILDSIDVESSTLNGLKLGRSTLQLHDTYLSPNTQPFAYRFTLYRIQNGPASVRVRVFGAYLD